MAIQKLSLPFVKNVEPQTKRIYYFDSTLPCFLLSVFPSGTKTFYIKYRNKYGQQRFFKIGNFPILTLEQAKKRACELLKDIELGGDPAQQKQDDKETLTVSELCDLYFGRGLGEKKASTIMNDKSRIERHIKPLIGNIPISALTRTHIEDMMTNITKGNKIALTKKSDKLRGKIIIRGGKDAATRTTQLLGAILKFAINRGKLINNPACGIKKPKTTVREAYLTLEDVQILGIVLNSPAVQTLHKTASDAIKLLLMTGCRKNEILTLKWNYIDFKNQIFRFPDTKTGKQDRPFGRGALNLLKSLENNKETEWVFPSKTDKSKHLTGLLRIFKNIQLTTDEKGDQIFVNPDINLHTLRHSFATIAHDELGFSELTIAGLLGHRLIKNTTNRYTHLIDKSQIQAADTISLRIANALNNTQTSTKVYDISKVV